MAYEPRDNSNTESSTSESSTRSVGIIAVIVVVMLAFGGYLFYANKNGSPVFSSSTAASAATDAMSSTKDAAVEVSQAVKDATTKGDQDTTRPNKDGSTNLLDQKPVKNGSTEQKPAN